MGATQYSGSGGESPAVLLIADVVCGAIIYTPSKAPSKTPPQTEIIKIFLLLLMVFSGE
jgi:hypothetical protein